MKKGMAILGAILLAVGLGMSFTGRALGGETRATVRLFGHSWEVTAPGMGHWNISTATVESPPDTGFSSTTEIGPFTGISLDVDLGNVTVAAGDDYLVDINYWGNGYQVLWANDGDTLQIWSESDGAVTEVNCGSDITVYVPAGAELEYLSARLDLGSLTMAGLTMDWADLDLNLGEVMGEGLTVRDNVNVDADLGSVALYGDLAGGVQINAALGDVTLGLSRSAAHYCWDLSADLGSVTVNGQRSGGFSSSVTGGDGDAVLQVDADLGSITVDFGYGEAAYSGDAYAEQEATTDHGWFSGPVSTVPPAPEPPSAPAAPEPPAVTDVPTVEQVG